MAQILKPNTDIAVGDWLPSAGSLLYPMLDEDSPVDSDYVYTESESVFEVGVEAASDPGSSADHFVRYRAAGDGATDLVVSLVDNSESPPAVIASWTETEVPVSETDYEHELTASEANSIVDYSALSLRFEAAAGGGAGDTSHVFADWDKDTTSAQTHIYASGHTVTAGNAIVIAVWSGLSGPNGGATGTATVEDNLGNTYTQVDQQNAADGDARGVSFVAKNVNGGANLTLTVTWSASTNLKTLIFHEVAGVHLTSPVVGNIANSQATPGTGTDAITSTAITPTADKAYIFGCNMAGAINGTVSVGTGFSDGSLDGYTAGELGADSEYLIQSSAASVAATFTDSSSTLQTITMLVALQPA